MTSHDLSAAVVQALLRSEAGARGQAAPAGAAPPAGAPFSIAISREAGAFGRSVAAEVGRRLGWPVYDRELLDKVAEEMRRPPAALQGVDERPGSFLEDCLAGLLRDYHVTADVYLKYLLGAVRGLGAVGRCVIVGRGANFILPAETTLRVRLVASREDRTQVAARLLNLPVADAAAWVERTERHRAEFMRRSFGQDPADPHHHDLVLNMSRLSVEEAADTVVGMLRAFEHRRPPAPREGAPAAGASPAAL
jgi:hypothetical protein